MVVIKNTRIKGVPSGPLSLMWSLTVAPRDFFVKEHNCDINPAYQTQH